MPNQVHSDVLYTNESVVALFSSFLPSFGYTLFNKLHKTRQGKPGMLVAFLLVYRTIGFSLLLFAPAKESG